MKTVLKKPLVTEKTSMLAESGVYSFKVDKKADKTEIKSAVEKRFEVKVKSVKTMICRGKSKRTAIGQSAPKYWKKAFVTLKEGEKIKIFEGGAN